MNPRHLFLCIAFSLLLVGKVHSQPFKSEGDFKKYFAEHAASLDTVEGLWIVNSFQEFYNYDTLYDEKSFSQTIAIVKKDSNFVSYDMKGGAYNAYFSKTDVNKVYIYKIWLKEIGRYTKADAVISSGRIMQYKYEFPEDYLHLLFKD